MFNSLNALHAEAKLPAVCQVLCNNHAIENFLIIFNSLCSSESHYQQIGKKHVKKSDIPDSLDQLP